MSSDPARESLRFALRRRMLELYAVVLVGLVVQDLVDLFTILPYVLGNLLGDLTTLVCGILVVAGLVGVVHRVLVDADRA